MKLESYIILYLLLKSSSFHYFYRFDGNCKMEQGRWGYLKIWSTPLVYLLVYPCITVFG